MRSPITLLTVTLVFSLAGCKSGNPQPPPVKHAAHQHGADHQHKEGKDGHGCGGQTAAAAQQGQTPLSFAEPPDSGTKARCPVARQVFVVTADTTRSEHSGKHYVFCCGGCKNTFDANPDAFTGR